MSWAPTQELPAGDPEDRVPGTATLVGTVVTTETGEPLPGARVRVLEADEERVTGPDGAFTVAGLRRGRYRVVTEYLGTSSDTAEVDLRVGWGQVARLTLDRGPIELPGLEVEVERTIRSPRLAAFYERMARGLGVYIGAEELERSDVIAAMRRVPHVRIEPCVASTGLRMGGCWDLKIARGALSERAFDTGGPCPPLIYLDGHLLPGRDVEVFQKRQYGTNAFSMIQSLSYGRLEGIEVYRNAATAPGQYRTLGDACGIILVWTRGR